MTTTKGKKTQPPVLVIVGASAGGLSALQAFFAAAVRADRPIESLPAFIVYQHLSPDHHSYMDDLLRKVTSCPVVVIMEELAPQPGHIYLPPPAGILSIKDGHICMTRNRNASRALNRPISECMMTVAADLGPASAGIILSGTGSDGAEGVRAIHEAGGITLVQDPSEAEFNPMPLAALATGVVDGKAPAASLIDTMMELCQDNKADSETPNDSDSRLQPAVNNWERLLTLLTERSGCNFQNYKPQTLLRRIERRLGLLGQASLDGFLELLYQEPEQVDILIEDILIGVTGFMRDAEAWEIFNRKHLRPLIERRVEAEKPLRLWCAGCATGEEAYTLSILIHEALAGRMEYCLFATDLNDSALAKARMARFSQQSMLHLPLALREKYTTELPDGRYQIADCVREPIVFSAHDLTVHPPFLHCDVVICRNLLIYLRQPMQQQVLGNLHSALNDDGILFLGSSESLGALASAWNTLSERWRVFSPRSGARRHIPRTTSPMVINTKKIRSYLSRSTVDADPITSSTSNQPWTEPMSITTHRSYEMFLQEAAEVSSITCLIVDIHLNLVHCIGDSRGILKVPSGPMSNRLHDLLTEDLKSAITHGINRALNDKTAVQLPRIDLINRGPTSIQINLSTVAGGDGFLLVTVQEARDLSPGGANDEAIVIDLNALQLAETRNRELSNELEILRTQLQANIEQIEAGNEELQSTNEELLSANEELQATNEELQALNEELSEVNAARDLKIKELSDAKSSLDLLSSSIDAAVVQVDAKLAVISYTDPGARLVGLADHAIGRPLNIACTAFSESEISDRAAEVLESGQPAVCTVTGLLGQELSALMRRIDRNHIKDGNSVVIILIHPERLPKAWQETTNK